jgi:hypothetical protein
VHYRTVSINVPNILDETMTNVDMPNPVVLDENQIMIGGPKKKDWTLWIGAGVSILFTVIT